MGQESEEINWQEKLTPEQYRILRQKGTERAFTSELLNNKKDGVYKCAGCGTPLFQSDTKYESGSGWPSFFDAIDEENIETEIDRSHGMTRTEILCSNCKGHLGHLFKDGPEPTGLRYCVNGVSLDFEEKQD